MTWYLTENIISGRGYLYGSKGDAVEIVADHGNVKIVQDNIGNRFSCKEDYLTNIEPKPKESETIQSTPEPSSVPGGKKTKSKKAAPPAQPGLFG